MLQFLRRQTWTWTWTDAYAPLGIWGGGQAGGNAVAADRRHGWPWTRPDTVAVAGRRADLTGVRQASLN